MRRGRREKIKEVYTAAILSRKGRKGFNRRVLKGFITQRAQRFNRRGRREKNAQRSQRKKTKEVFTAAILSRKGFILTALKGRNILARR